MTFRLKLVRSPHGDALPPLRLQKEFVNLQAVLLLLSLWSEVLLQFAAKNIKILLLRLAE